MWGALSSMFLGRRATNLLYQKAYVKKSHRDEQTVEYVVTVNFFNRHQQRFKHQDFRVMGYGVTLAMKYPNHGWCYQHILTSAVMDLLRDRIRDPLRVVSKNFLNEFSGFRNITTTIGMFCDNPYLPYGFTAKYGQVDG